MESRNRAYRSVFAAVLLLAIAAVVFTGCKDEQAAAPKEVSQAQAEHDHDHDHPHAHSHETVAEKAATTAQEAGEEVKAQVAAVTEQTTCPVMAGNPINKEIFVEYEGKKVYFCCKGCEDTFLADPAQYVAKLPQFQDQK